MQLVLVGRDQRQIRRILALHLDAGAPQFVGEHSSPASSTARTSTGFGSRGFCRASARKLLTIRAQRSAAARRRPSECAPRVADLLLEHHRPAQHDGQRIVQLVRHAGQQRAQRGQLLTLVCGLSLAVRFDLGPLAAADIDDETRQRSDSPRFVPDREADHHPPCVMREVRKVLLVDDDGALLHNLPIEGGRITAASFGLKMSSGMRPMIRAIGRFWTFSISGLTMM